MFNNAEDFGKAFSAVAVVHATRLTNIASLLDATRTLYSAIEEEIQAETLAANNQPSTPSWANFRANGTAGTDGINNDVQDKAEALWTAFNAIV